MEVVESGKNYALKLDAENTIVLMKFIGDMSDEEYKSFWTRSINFAVERQINRVIIDQGEIGNVSFKARGWVVINAFPRVKKEMPRNMAASILSSGRVVQKTGMQYLLKAFKAITNYQVEVHPTVEDCVAFLKKANELEKVES